jgi:hypothetical protein
METYEKKNFFSYEYTHGLIFHNTKGVLMKKFIVYVYLSCNASTSFHHKSQDVDHLLLITIFRHNEKFNLE